MASVLSLPSFILANPDSKIKFRKFCRVKPPIMSLAAFSNETDENSNGNSTKLVTFLGKGGSGKTTSAVFAAKHYAMAGLNTCLVIHSQDFSADYLLNCKIGTSPIKCSDNLSAVRLQTTKMLLQPLEMLKKSDARLNMTQGVLEGVVGEELGVLPGMDSIFSAFALEKYLGYFTKVTSKSSKKQEFDVIVYDGINTEETLRLIAAPSKARLYLKYLRNLAEKTDLGRLAGPSIIRLVDEATGISSMSKLSANTSAAIWDTLDQMLERGAAAFLNPSLFHCFLVMDVSSTLSLNSALRYWGCTIQSGGQISGAICLSSRDMMNVESVKGVKKKFEPLPVASIPHVSTNSPIDWNQIILDSVNKNARDLFSSRGDSILISPVKFELAKRSLTIFMPGFDKSEIKLYQYRGGSELLVEAGDQRRVIHLPPKVQGKVGGAKFVDRSLVITMR